MKHTAQPTRPLQVTQVKNVDSVKGGTCHLGLACGLVIENHHFIIVANTEASLRFLLEKQLATPFDPSFLNDTKAYPVAVVQESAVTLEDDEL